MNNENKKSPILAFFGLKSQKANKLSKQTEKTFCNGVLSICNGIAIDRPTEKHGKYLIAPYGDFYIGDIAQRVDKITAANLQHNLNSVWSRIRSIYGNACPVYYEHPDEEDALNYPLATDKTPYGKVRSLENCSDGIYANIEWLDGFESLPKHLQISPRWNFDVIGEKAVRQTRLISLGLTKHPNIKQTSFVNSKKETQTKEIIMDKEILLLLGYSEEQAQKIINKAADAPTDVLERIKVALAKKAEIANSLDAAKKDGEEKDKQLETTKVALANSLTALKASQTHRASLIVANAVRNGKILEAQRDSAVKILANSENFEEEAQKLDEQKPQIKTEAKTNGIEKTEKERLFDQQKAQGEFAKLVAEKQSQGMEYGEAWNAAKMDKPEIFKAAYPSD